VSAPKDGGPAFPASREQWDTGLWGMTLRDYFAGKALQGTQANPDGWTSNEKCAAWCYQMADAMLAERERGRQ
jgi:hypothetical protein